MSGSRHGYNSGSGLPPEAGPWIVGIIAAIGFFAFVSYKIAAAVGADWAVTTWSLIFAVVATVAAVALFFTIGQNRYQPPYWIGTGWAAMMWLFICRVADTTPLRGAGYPPWSSYPTSQRMPWDTASHTFSSGDWGYSVVAFMQNPWAFWVIFLSLVAFTIWRLVDN